MLLIFYGGQIGINKLAEAQGWDYIEDSAFHRWRAHHRLHLWRLPHRNFSRRDSGRAQRLRQKRRFAFGMSRAIW